MPIRSSLNKLPVSCMQLFTVGSPRGAIQEGYFIAEWFWLIVVQAL